MKDLKNKEIRKLEFEACVHFLFIMNKLHYERLNYITINVSQKS